MLFFVVSKYQPTVGSKNNRLELDSQYFTLGRKYKQSNHERMKFVPPQLWGQW